MASPATEPSFTVGNALRKALAIFRASNPKNAGKFPDIESENLLRLASCFYLCTRFDIYALSGIFAGIEPAKMRDFEKLVPRFSKSRSDLKKYHQG